MAGQGSVLQSVATAFCCSAEGPRVTFSSSQIIPLASADKLGLKRAGPRPPNGAQSICKDGKTNYDHTREAGHAPGAT